MVLHNTFMDHRQNKHTLHKKGLDRCYHQEKRHTAVATKVAQLQIEPVDPTTNPLVVAFTSCSRPAALSRSEPAQSVVVQRKVSWAVRIQNNTRSLGGTEVTSRYSEALRRVLPRIAPDELWWRFERTHGLLLAKQGRRSGATPQGQVRPGQSTARRACVVDQLSGKGTYRPQQPAHSATEAARSGAREGARGLPARTSQRCFSTSRSA